MFGEKVAEIGDDAFFGCMALTRITLPESIVRIGDWAFFGCRNLTGVVIGKKLVFIGGAAFDDCELLADVYYSGSEEDWSKIEIYPSNDELIAATMHYNYVPENQ